MKRFAAVAVAIALMLSCLVGCGKQEEQLPSAAPASTGYEYQQPAEAAPSTSAESSAPTGVQEQPAASPAIDSSLESFISLPINGYPLDMVRLSDGRLRVSLMNEDEQYQVFTQDASGNWTEDVTLPDSIWDLGYKDQLRLSPDGSVFISMLEDKGNGSYENHFLLYTATGELRELPVDYTEAGTDGFFLGGVDFTDSGKLMVLFNFNDLREVNLSDGSLSENLNIQSADLATANMGCAGENTYLYSAMGDGKCTLVRDGQQTDLPATLSEKLSASVLVTAGAAVKNVFWLDTDGTLYFTTSEGLFRLAQGSDSAEQLASGADSSFGDSLFIPLAITGGENGTVYVLADLSNQTVLCRFNTNR